MSVIEMTKCESCEVHMTGLDLRSHGEVILNNRAVLACGVSFPDGLARTLTKSAGEALEEYDFEEGEPLPVIRGFIVRQQVVIIEWCDPIFGMIAQQWVYSDGLSEWVDV